MTDATSKAVTAEPDHCSLSMVCLDGHWVTKTSLALSGIPETRPAGKLRIVSRRDGQLVVEDLDERSPEALRHLAERRDEARKLKGQAPVKYVRRPGNSIVFPNMPLRTPGTFGRFTLPDWAPKKVLGNYARALQVCRLCGLAPSLLTLPVLGDDCRRDPSQGGIAGGPRAAQNATTD
jgi:hypothetical protein